MKPDERVCSSPSWVTVTHAPLLELDWATAGPGLFLNTCWAQMSFENKLAVSFENICSTCKLQVLSTGVFPGYLTCSGFLNVGHRLVGQWLCSESSWAKLRVRSGPDPTLGLLLALSSIVVAVDLWSVCISWKGCADTCKHIYIHIWNTWDPFMYNLLYCTSETEVHLCCHNCHDCVSANDTLQNRPVEVPKPSLWGAGSS